MKTPPAEGFFIGQTEEMKFIDEAVIEVQAGKGGAGSRHFRREAYVPLGGPDGGDGGNGGSVVLKADRNRQTLLDFRFQPKWKADDGDAGSGSNRTGRSAEDLVIHVPIGTQIFDDENGELLIDLEEDGQEYVVAKGGRGGRGNTFFKTPTHQAPEHAQPGEPGGECRCRLSLKLVADVGLIGFPNAGKSTLISRISSAKPKIADYPFTTLTPNLGVVAGKGTFSFTVADIPGLIPGASEGKGLGIKFLKHIERTKVLAHLIDLAAYDEEGNSQDPILAFDQINTELREFSSELANKPQLVILTKTDAVPDKASIDEVIATFKKREITAIAISSVSGDGIEVLKDRFQELLRSIP